MAPSSVVSVNYRDFNLLHRSLLKRFPLFIWLLFAGLFSTNCCADTLSGGGLLFRFACSVVLWGGRGTANKCHWRVWGALAVFQPPWVCLRSQRVCFPHLHCSGSRLLSRERALSCVDFPGPSRSGSGFQVLHKGADSVGSAFCAFPGRSISSNQELEEGTLSPLRSPPQFPGAPGPCALCLFRGDDL